jgi:hypothetical protein
MGGSNLHVCATWQQFRILGPDVYKAVSGRLDGNLRGRLAGRKLDRSQRIDLTRGLPRLEDDA